MKYPIGFKFTNREPYITDYKIYDVLQKIDNITYYRVEARYRRDEMDYLSFNIVSEKYIYDLVIQDRIRKINLVN